MKYEYPDSIEAAAKILDAEYPKWATRIKIDQLNFGEIDKCIMGQLYGNYSSGIVKLFEFNCDNIFGSNANKDLWINEINKRYILYHTSLKSGQQFQIKDDMKNHPNKKYMKIRTGQFVDLDNGNIYNENICDTRPIIVVE